MNDANPTGKQSVHLSSIRFAVSLPVPFRPSIFDKAHKLPFLSFHPSIQVIHPSDDASSQPILLCPSIARSISLASARSGPHQFKANFAPKHELGTRKQDKPIKFKPGFNATDSITLHRKRSPCRESFEILYKNCVFAFSIRPCRSRSIEIITRISQTHAFTFLSLFLLLFFQ